MQITITLQRSASPPPRLTKLKAIQAQLPILLWADSGMDTIRDFEPGKDAIALTRGLTSSQLSITQANSDTLIRLTATGQILATLNNVFIAPTILD